MIEDLHPKSVQIRDAIWQIKVSVSEGFLAAANVPNSTGAELHEFVRSVQLSRKKREDAFERLLQIADKLEEEETK